MHIFSFKKPIVVDLFTTEESAIDTYKIDFSRNVLPEWWKKTPKQVEEKGFIPSPTLKTCSGLIDFNRSGLLVPLWTDIAFKVENGIYEWQCADMKTELEVHSSSQWDFYATPHEFGHVKIKSVWAFSTNKNIDWLMTNAYWHHKPIQPYSITPGIIDVHAVKLPINVQLFLDLQKNTKFIMEAGSPLVQMIPLTDKPIELKYNLVSQAEFDKYSVVVKSKFINGYRTRVRQVTESKCPFHK